MALNSKKGAAKKKPTTTVSGSVGNYDKHPFYIKKAAEVKALLLEVGLPKQLSKKAN